MEFEAKVKSMKFSEIMQAMISGLQNEHVRVDMDTYGYFEGRELVCYGCAATNSLCEISGKKFTGPEVIHERDRADFLEVKQGFIYSFEQAIDSLRKGGSYEYNLYASDVAIALVPEEFNDLIGLLPVLDTWNFKKHLPEYQAACDTIKAAGY
jgi:hypothetical protein